MFVGQHEHSLDGKGRVVLPAKFRSHVAERGYITRLDKCLGLWSEASFTVVAERWKADLEAGRMQLRVFRKLLNNVQEVKLDSAGRINLPQELLVSLDFKTQVVVCGLYDRVEIWPVEMYESEQEGADIEEELSEAVARLGI